MQFVVIAYDYKNEGLERRLASRKEHVELGDRMKADGNYLMEPYVVNKVWEKIEVIPCKVGPSFTK